MADEIVYVTVTASITEIVEVEADTYDPIVVNVLVNELFEGFTFVSDTTPVTDVVGHTWYNFATGLSYVWYDGGWKPLQDPVAVPTGTIIQGGWATAPPGCAFLDGSTLVGGAALYPEIASQYPSWVVGADIVLPTMAGFTLIGTTGVAGTKPITSNAKTVTISANNLPTHTHSVSITSAAENRGHVHYLDTTAGGWAPTAGMGNPSANHTHTSGHGTNAGSQSPLGAGASWAFPGGGTKPQTGTVSSWHTHALSGYTSGAHQTHTHVVSGNTGNNTTTATALPYNTTPAHMIVKYAVKL